MHIAATAMHGSASYHFLPGQSLLPMSDLTSTSSTCSSSLSERHCPRSKSSQPCCDRSSILVAVLVWDRSRKVVLKSDISAATSLASAPHSWQIISISQMLIDLSLKRAWAVNSNNCWMNVRFCCWNLLHFCCASSKTTMNVSALKRASPVKQSSLELQLMPNQLMWFQIKWLMAWLQCIFWKILLARYIHKHQSFRWIKMKYCKWNNLW